VKLYKLTNAKDRTYGATQWGEGVEHTAPGGGPMCTDHWLHAYRHPLLAVVMDPAHANLGATRHLWLADGDVGADGGTKVGCTRLKTIRRMKEPKRPSTGALVRFAIYSVRALNANMPDAWGAWAKGWLSGRDRSAEAAARAEARSAEAARAPIDFLSLLRKAIRDEARHERGKEARRGK
jgi:hypothetical protein